MNDAIELMFGVYRTPARSTQLCYRELPGGLIDVVRIAAGDSRSLRRGQAITGLDDPALHDAATLLLQQLLFFDGADSYRVLGVTPGASAEQIKRHHRWLMRWLHPDRDPSNEHSVYSERVNSAWNDVRTEERRANYDLALATGTLDDPPRAATRGELPRARFDGGHTPWVSGRLVRRLPQVVVATSTIVIGAAALVAFLWSRDDDADLSGIETLHTTVGEDTHVRPPTTPAASAFDDFAAIAAAHADESATTATVPTVRAVASRPPDAESTETGTVSPAVDAGAASTRRAVVTARATPSRSTPVAIVETDASRDTAAMTLAPPAELSEDDARAIVIRFQALYASDDVDDFLRLFAEDARTNSGGIDAIRDDYRRLFRGRAFRRMQLIDMQWDIRGAQAIGRGRYEARVGKRGDAAPVSTRGNIELGLRRTADGLRITRLRHDIVDERG